MKVTVEITLGSLKLAGKKAKRTGAVISIMLALVSGSYVASGNAQVPHVAINWQQEC